MLRHYITKNGKTMRCGYTTGSCAAGAAKAAARMLLTGQVVEEVALDTPKGIRLTLEILNPEIGESFARCAVQKDSGDDPDITNGILVYVTAEKTDVGIVIDGGEGVGRVTKEGLDQPVGAAAINSTPRRMIAEAVEAISAENGYTGGMKITVSIPDGAELAKKTFNPRIGIVGGISVIGTTGIVEPMSNAALVDTIRLELSVLSAAGHKGVLLCPGNYGETFARETLGLDMSRQVSVSNFIGDGIEAAVGYGFKRILLVGHIGKLVKLGIGLHNTHSAYGDGRMETLIACALECCGDIELLRAILNCVTTDAALETITDRGLLEPVLAVLGRRIQATLERKVPVGTEIGFICFTNAEPWKGVLMQSDNAERLAAEWKC
ncbi:MAG: cobalt-precorrin-5B (C(1))-methyltransferase CbiD [Clostridia bacterium]|nr:cobalt-precorrin-5B (C(1))-methyltransferase CbiD [Clostridia bacterium]